MIQNILVGIIFIAALWFVGRALYRQLAGKATHCDDCAVQHKPLKKTGR